MGPALLALVVAMQLHIVSLTLFLLSHASLVYSSPWELSIDQQRLNIFGPQALPKRQGACYYEGRYLSGYFLCPSSALKCIGVNRR